MEFPVHRTLSDSFIEYRVGSNTLALGMATSSTIRLRHQAPSHSSWLSVLRPMPWPCVPPRCKGRNARASLTDQPFGHRTVFFRDPDGNVVEIFAEI
jgi:lactoylglutathione lyase